VELETLELIDPASIDTFAGRFLSSGRPLDILIHNAGIMAPPLRRDARGYESQFATNHLGHFQLSARLWPALKQAGKARVVAVSSTGISFGGVDFDDPNFERREYDKWKAYGQSKTANALFAVVLDKRGQAHGIRAFSAHPGGIYTDLARHLSLEELAFDGELKTPEQGAATSVWCATSPQLEGERRGLLHGRRDRRGHFRIYPKGSRPTTDGSPSLGYRSRPGGATVAAEREDDRR